MANGNDLISMAQAAAIIGITPQRARRYVDDGRLKAMRVGRAFVIRRGDAKKIVRRGAGRPKGK